MAQGDNVVAVILGGGAGSRLFPLTQETDLRPDAVQFGVAQSPHLANIPLFELFHGLC
jgi:ADP-glucose pyrophosphorylase